MAQSAIFIDAGFLLSAGGTVVTGTSLRSAILVKFPELISGIVEATRKNCGLDPLRVYWYDASHGGFTDEHRRIAMLEDVKVRLGRISYDGAQKGVDLRLGLDLVEVARTGAAQVAYLVSGDDDLAEAVLAAQDLGMKVALVGIEDQRSRIGVMSVAEHLAMQVDRIVRLERSFIERVISGRPRLPVTTGTLPISPAAFGAPNGVFGAVNSEGSALVGERDTADGANSPETAAHAAGAKDANVSAASGVGQGSAAGAAHGTADAHADGTGVNGTGSNGTAANGGEQTSRSTLPHEAGPTPKDMAAKPQHSMAKHYSSREIMPQDAVRDLTELAKIAGEVGESVAAKWLEGATQRELNETLEYRPMLPSEIDRALLRDCAARVGEHDTDIQFVRRQLRQSFWERIDES